MRLCVRVSAAAAGDGDRPQQSATHTQVGHEGAEDEQGAPPAVVVDEQLDGGRQQEGADAAARHGHAVRQRFAAAEVAAHGGDGGRVAQSEAHTWQGHTHTHIYIYI